jgi:undecaprenyl-diphosphatase
MKKVAQNFILHLFIAFLPAAIMGLLFHKMIKFYLFNPIIVGISLIIGGFIMILIEKKLTIKTKTNVDQITKKQALVVGLAQCFRFNSGGFKVCVYYHGWFNIGAGSKNGN